MRLQLEITPPQRQPYRWETQDRDVLVGRDSNCQLLFAGDEHEIVSWRHLLIELRPGGVFASDQNSLNGTFLNGDRIRRRVMLRPGDILSLGTAGPQLKLIEIEPTPNILEKPQPRGNRADKSSRPAVDLTRFRGGARLFFWAVPIALGLVLGLLAVNSILPTNATVESPVPVPPPDNSNDNNSDNEELARQAEDILRRNCLTCHGEQGSDKGGIDFILDREALVDNEFLNPGNADESRLFEVVSSKEMPPPGKKPRPSGAETEALKKWIDAGAPDFNPRVVTEPRKFITNDDIVAAINRDVLTLNERDRQHARYFTLTHLYNAGVDEARLRNFRGAIAKLVNSLSWEAEIANPVRVDDTGTILRIDLRDFDWTAEIWEHLVAANPYSFYPNTLKMEDCRRQTQAELPFVRGDWFVFAAARPPLYHDVLQLPENVSELEELIDVDATANIQRDRVCRAAFVKSGVSNHNRMVERHGSKFGYYYKSYDNDADEGRKNFFNHPLGPEEALSAELRDNAFVFAGGEMIFSLPNGLQGYYLAAADGTRLNEAPTNIVIDKNRGEQIVNGISCMRCHYDGLIRVSDGVRATILSSSELFPGRDDILALYGPPAELSRRFDEDIQRFRQSMSRMGLNTKAEEGEPIGNISAKFERELDLMLAAAEVGVEPVILKTAIEQDNVLKSILALRTLSTGEKVARGAFKEAFPTIVRQMNLGRVPE